MDDRKDKSPLSKNQKKLTTIDKEGLFDELFDDI